jgi:hypothetical protein
MTLLIHALPIFSVAIAARFSAVSKTFWIVDLNLQSVDVNAISNKYTITHRIIKILRVRFL